MPTSSTAKLIAKRQNKFPEAQNETEVPRQRLFYRRRPKSSRYDSYRLRSRRSMVDENLFGEPLKNKLMSRSKSMEALSQLNQQNDNQEPEQEVQCSQKLFIRRKQPPERPKTALATMRTGRPREPEFQQQHVQVISRDNVRSLIIPQNREKQIQPLILSRREFEKIIAASKVMSSSERAALRKKQLDEINAIAKESQDRRERLMASSNACAQSTYLTETERENMEKDHHVLERAEHIRDESLPEVKYLNQLISEAKCQAIRDNQINQKRKQFEDMAEADRHLEEEMEKERNIAIEMANQRDKHLNVFREDYRKGLEQQRIEQEALKLLEMEQKQQELQIRRELENAQRETEIKEKENKIETIKRIRSQMFQELNETRARKELLLKAQKQDEDRILALQDERRKKEIAKEEEEKEKRKLLEMEKKRILDQIEQDKKIEYVREDIRLLRQQEQQDRQWREKELEKVKSKAKREKEIQQIRLEQQRQKLEDAARSIHIEKEHWENTKKNWQDEMSKELEDKEKKNKKKKEYLNDLQSQMEVNRSIKAKTNVESKHSLDSSKHQQYQDRLEKVRERKLQQLRAYNIPEKYLKEIEKKFHHMGKSRFTLSYFGKK